MPCFPKLFSFIVILFLSIISIKPVHGQVVAFGFCPRPEPMESLDITRYQGLWYEVERYWHWFEAFTSCVNVHYTYTGSNDTFGVEIRQLQFGKIRVSPGTSYFASRDGSADIILDLLITRSPIPFKFRYQYLIINTDYTNYSIKWACRQFGPLNYQTLLILSRNKLLSPKIRNEVYTILRKNGISSHYLRKSEQGGCGNPKRY